MIEVDLTSLGKENPFELIRFNPANNHIEYSTSRGSSWFRRK